MYNIHNIHVCVVAQNQANVAIFSIGTMTKVWYDFRKIITILLNNSVILVPVSVWQLTCTAHILMQFCIVNSIMLFTFLFNFNILLLPIV